MPGDEEDSREDLLEETQGTQTVEHPKLLLRATEILRATAKMYGLLPYNTLREDARLLRVCQARYLWTTADAGTLSLLA